MSKNLAESIKLNKPIESPSMGCQVERTICTICGEEAHSAAQHEGKVVQYDPDDYSNLGNVMFSLVSAPKCGECQAPMKYLKQGTEWACQEATCTELDVAVATGIGGVIG